MELLLNKNKSKKSSNINNSIPIKLYGRNRILSTNDFTSSVSEMDIYNNERMFSNIIRLTCVINPLCSNVLFNPITEAVQNEGSDFCSCFNINGVPEGTTLHHKNYYSLTSCTTDTQLSSNNLDYTYHCGLDIFNNHIIRSKVFKTVCKYPQPTTTYEHFNTISDYMRNSDGIEIGGYKDYTNEDKTSVSNNQSIKKLHLYLNEDLLSFKECIDEKLTVNNGWYGFYNSGKFCQDKDLQIYNVINNKRPCSFIDMYPSRDLWCLTPKYNDARKRIEKNWDYCLTYPSSSTTEVSFINQELNSLKICMYDDNISSNFGLNGVRIYSASKHGLVKDDTINIYTDNNILINNAKVFNVDDEYTFSVYTEMKISEKYYQLSNDELLDDVIEIWGELYEFSELKNSLHLKSDKNHILPILPNKNVCVDFKHLSFKKVVNGEEVDYYVRVFSKIPNWKFANTLPTNDESKMKTYQGVDYDFSSHMSKLAFAKNIYGDDISEIVFTDDIDLTNLTDNLGRPLTEVYLTLFKTNIGHYEWYNNKDITNEYIEYSHCFGKLNCAFKLSDKSLYDESYINSLNINGVTDNYVLTKTKNGLNQNSLNKERNEHIHRDLAQDEIQYRKIKTNTQSTQVYDINGKREVLESVLLDESESYIYSGDTKFYGDLCCYSKSLLHEESIQMVDFRFNTYQREHPIQDLKYDEIEYDDYDSKPFKVAIKTINDEKLLRLEGYCYTPHYKIPLHTFSEDIYSEHPIFISYRKILIFGDGSISIMFSKKPELFKNDIFYIRTDKKYYKYKVIREHINSITNRLTDVSCEPIGDGLIDENEKVLRMFKYNEYVPNYAELSTNGSTMFVWREIIKNGFDDSDKIEQYPFMNNAFYINKNINLYVRRQDPNGFARLKPKEFPFDIESNILESINDKYYLESDIEC